MFPHQYENIVTLLRSLTTYMLIHENIEFLSSIHLIPLFKETKHISLFHDENKDTFYLEHLSSFKIDWWDDETKNWSSQSWKRWIIECIELLKMYPTIQKTLFKFYENEIEIHFKKSMHQMKQLREHYKNFQNEMIESWFFMKRECQENVTSMLEGHIQAMDIIFKQITSSNIKKTIAKDIFSIVEIYSRIIEKSLDDPKKMNNTVLDFKKEVNKTINHHVSFVKTDTINFKWWLLSLYQFIFSCDLIRFDIKKNIIKLNMVLYFAFPVDDVLKYKHVHVNNKKITNQRILRIHPFMRGAFCNHYI